MIEADGVLRAISLDYEGAPASAVKSGPLQQRLARLSGGKACAGADLTTDTANDSLAPPPMPAGSAPCSNPKPIIGAELLPLVLANHSMPRLSCAMAMAGASATSRSNTGQAAGRSARSGI